MDGWAPGAAGVVTVPSGRRVRGRGLHDPVDGSPPALGLVLLGRRPPPSPWETRWVRWPDFRLPASPTELHLALAELHDRAASERVEVVCSGGTGRTGTALACLAVLDGVPSDEAVDWVRARYRRRAVETRAQRRFVAAFPAPDGGR